jgi:hypothetical protein
MVRFRRHFATSWAKTDALAAIKDRFRSMTDAFRRIACGFRAVADVLPSDEDAFPAIARSLRQAGEAGARRVASPLKTIRRVGARKTTLRRCMMIVCVTNAVGECNEIRIGQ